MRTIHAEETQLINARPDVIYSILADYHQGHPAIVPKEYFQEVKVEKGGVGAGTEILIRMKVLGRETVSRQVVSEPEPGRVLVEAEPDGRVKTTFTVDPVNSGAQSRLTIATDMQASSGIAGMIEGWMIPLILRRIYQKELANIADYARQQTV